MTRIAIVTGANQDQGFALAEDLVSGRAAVPRAPRVAPERRPDPTQATLAPLWLAPGGGQPHDPIWADNRKVDL
jgi:NAD(P)-dependent dehydrogenase (short-subunit alcohol dehydrogenase family)